MAISTIHENQTIRRSCKCAVCMLKYEFFLFFFSSSGNRCIADFFSLYLDALGGNGSFYRRPIPGNTIRFSNQNIGINKLKTFMKSICEKGGLGQLSNHSGKRTCATQLYRADVEEQEIMQRTGHRSTTTIRKYKRSNDEISAKVSCVLDPPQPNVSDIPNKKVCTSQENVLTECFKDQSEKNISTERNANQGHGKGFNNCEIHYWNLNPTQL